MSFITRLVQPFSDLVRWGEPWDVEDDEGTFDVGLVRADVDFFSR